MLFKSRYCGIFFFMTDHKYTNELINETSPYLLQHAHNPVNWHAWNNASLQKAKKEDKPILVSIGYSACHWCHVMERESFENEETAQLMNAHYVNIKIDREERPDIDHIYMDAVQTMTGSGGWPLNVFLTPDLKPFYGGTYFPPQRAFNRISWKEVLLAVAQAYREKRNEIIQQAENLIEHLLNANSFTSSNQILSIEQKTTKAIAENLIRTADKEWGGFGQAPKFPQTFSILYLLREFYLSRNESSLEIALLCLDKMMAGGIYDHIGGGFCRYSTDKRWQIPHFEKMLYDNALLVYAYAEAYQLTNRKAYADTINESIEFIQRELTSPENGFYSALDADSEGVEGKYYTWTKKEIDDLLGDDSALFCAAYNISGPGNWEDTNIVWMPESLEKIADLQQLTVDEVQKRLKVSRKILFLERQKRTRPALDDKVLLNWNALMVTGLCKAWQALQEESYLEMAKKSIDFIERYLHDKESDLLLHSWNKVNNIQSAFLDDYAALIQAYIYLHQSTSDIEYLLKAKALTEKVIENFSDAEGVLFYFTPAKQSDIPIRKKEIYDGATPSGNALMAHNLIELSVLFDIPEWKKRAEAMAANMLRMAENYPTSFGVWSLLIQLFINGLREITVVGHDFRSLTRQIIHEYLPYKIMQGALKANNDWPLLKQKIISPNETNIYICENYKCHPPINGLESFRDFLNKTFLVKSPVPIK
jgi:uncharacterized protein YyaL (SSP411 family)